MKKFLFFIFLLVGILCNTANSNPNIPSPSVQECTMGYTWTVTNPNGSTCVMGVYATASSCAEAGKLLDRCMHQLGYY